MKAFVLDCSVTIGWCFSDEANALSDRALEQLQTAEAIVPPVWALEVTNVMVMAERAKRITPARVKEFFELLQELPIRVVEIHPRRIFDKVFELARLHRLSSYDASYLELALRENVPLVTSDRDLSRAAHECRLPKS